MAGNDSDVLFKTKYGHQSSRGQIESLGPQEPVDDNDKKLFAGDNAYTLKKYIGYAENANSSYGGQTMLEKANINLTVTLIDSKKEGNKVTRKKKKDDDIDDMRVASILRHSKMEMRSRC
ncbi:hypothetical protein Tco_1116668 [Tanacetum coccineum]